MISITINNVETYPSILSFPATGEENIIYIDDNTNIAYRWDGAAYASISGGGGGTVESFYLERVETIDENTTTAKEYFTFAQNGTQINNVINAAGGTYNIKFSFICANTSTGGSVIVNPQINGANVFSQPYTHEPKDTINISYITINKQVNLTAGNNTIEIKLSNDGGGTGRIFEASTTIIKA